eukprot:6204070-Pleurochrysis_carterae.AAC.2
MFSREAARFRLFTRIMQLNTYKFISSLWPEQTSSSNIASRGCAAASPSERRIKAALARVALTRLALSLLTPKPRKSTGSRPRPHLTLQKARSFDLRYLHAYQNITTRVSPLLWL